MIRSILAVLAGLVTTMVLVMLSTVATAMVVLGGIDRQPTTAYLVVNLLCGALSALAGGYVTGWIAQQKVVQHAAGLSAVLLLLGLPGLFAPVAGQPVWYPAVILVIGVVFALLGGYLRGRQAGSA
jgi:hypothetical protein